MSNDTQLLITAVAHQWQCDHFGHLNVRNYAAIFDDAIFMFWGNHSTSCRDAIAPVTADFRMSFRKEVPAGTLLAVSGGITQVGSKSVTLALKMTGVQTEHLFAACDVVEVFFDLQKRESAKIPQSTKERLVGAKIEATGNE